MIKLLFRFMGKILLYLSPLTFIIGWFLAKGTVGDAPSFFLHSILSAFATFILVVSISKKKLTATLPIIVLILIFVLGYYLKFYWIVLKVGQGDFNDISQSIDSNVLKVLYPENLVRAFEMTSYGYMALACSAIFCRFSGMIPPCEQRLDGVTLGRQSIRIITIIAFALFVVTSLVFYFFSIGVRGAENVALPFKLTGITTYAREFTFFLFLVVLVWAELRDNKSYWYLGLLGLVLFVTSKIFLEASRGAPIALVIALGTIWLVYHRFTKKRLFFLSSVFMLVVILRPLFTVFRELRAFDMSLSPLTLILKSSQQLDFSKVDVGEFFFEAAKTVLLRVIGVDSVLYTTNGELVLLDLHELVTVVTDKIDFGQKFTQEVVGYGHTITTHYSSPSLVGGCYLLGGLFFMLFFTCLFTIVAQCAWKRAIYTKWKSQPIIVVVIIMTVFSIGSEGNIVMSVKEISVVIAFIVGLESVLRLLSPKRPPIRNNSISQQSCLPSNPPIV